MTVVSFVFTAALSQVVDLTADGVVRSAVLYVKDCTGTFMVEGGQTSNGPWAPITSNNGVADGSWPIPFSVPRFIRCRRFRSDGVVPQGSAWLEVMAVPGGVGPQGPQGAQGPAGATGPQGPQGPAATLPFGMHDDFFEPNRVDVSPGATVRLLEQSLTHEFEGTAHYWGSLVTTAADYVIIAVDHFAGVYASPLSYTVGQGEGNMAFTSSLFRTGSTYGTYDPYIFNGSILVANGPHVVYLEYTNPNAFPVKVSGNIYRRLVTA